MLLPIFSSPALRNCFTSPELTNRDRVRSRIDVAAPLAGDGDICGACGNQQKNRSHSPLVPGFLPLSLFSLPLVCLRTSSTLGSRSPLHGREGKRDIRDPGVPASVGTLFVATTHPIIHHTVQCGSPSASHRCCIRGRASALPCCSEPIIKIPLLNCDRASHSTVTHSVCVQMDSTAFTPFKSVLTPSFVVLHIFSVSQQSICKTQSLGDPQH